VLALQLCVVLYLVERRVTTGVTVVVQTVSNRTASDAFDRLFMALAEELKSPLLRIARHAELLALNGGAEDGLTSVRMNADMTLQLLDSYLLSLQLTRDPETAFAVQPVSVSAVLHEAQGRLADVAREYSVELELDIAGKYEPVMANDRALTTALVSLGYSLIEALPAMGTRQMRLQLAAHRTKYGIVAGMYCDAHALTPESLRRAQELYGHTRQPFVGTLSGSGAGIFVADAILHAMSSRLRVGRYQRLPGFAATFAPSQQLQLI
jgi:hypothetical protein